MSHSWADAAALPKGRIPSLDGLRALSILLVLLGHLSGTHGFTEVSLGIGDYANFGVRVFFVISGFLITSLLFKEVDKTGRIDLKGFYFRRIFRIFPAFYFYLSVVAVLGALSIVALPWIDWLWSATYLVNFIPKKAWIVGHIWSLSVEEQFYMLWPATMVLLGVSRAIKAAVVVALLAPLCRIGWFYAFPEAQTLIGEAFPTVMDSIAVGCVLSSCRQWLGRQSRYQKFCQSPLFLLVPAAALGLNALPYTRLGWLIGETLINICIALVIDRTIRIPDDAVGRVLNWGPLCYVGTLSYSLYLWQQPFLNRHSDELWCMFPINIIAAIGCAVLSYYLVERPMLRWRARLSAAKKSRQAQIAEAT